MFTLFYESGNHWFDVIANCCVWFLIAAALFFTGWVGYDLVTGPRKQREEVKRMLEGITSAKGAAVFGHELTRNLSGASKPFSRKAKTSKVPAHAELDS